MTGLVFTAVLSSSFLQASWNFLAKKTSANKTVLLLVGWLLFGLILTPLSLFYEDLSILTWTSWKFILLSGCIHFLYVILLGWAYTVADISVIYPIARGTGIALTTLVASLVGIDEISFMGSLGILTVILGTFVIASRELSRAESLKGFCVAILVACAISSYSLIDSMGVQHVPIFFFIAMMNLLTGLMSIPLLITRYKREAVEVIKTRKTEALSIAFAGSAAYAIIMWAYTQTATSYVVALREFSIVIASGLGVWILKEKLYFNRAFGISVILMGVFLVRLS